MDVKHEFTQTVYMHCYYYGEKVINGLKIRIYHISNRCSGNQSYSEYMTNTGKITNKK